MKHHTRVDAAISILLIASLALPACDAGEASGDAFSLRDSSGVRIAESSGPAWSPEEAWVVQADPVLVIGDDPGEELFRVVDAGRLADGRVMVANRGTGEILLFDASGAAVDTVGGEGEGPGEFLSLSFARPYRGDSILAWDPRQRRVSVFSASGELGRIVRAPDEAFGGRGPNVFSSLSTGELLAYTLGGQSPERGYYTFRFLTLSPGGEPLADLGELPAGACATARSCHLGWYGPFAAYTSGDTSFFFGYPRDYQIARYGSRGELLQLIRKEWRPLPISGPDIESFRAHALEVDQDLTEEGFGRRLADQDVPDYMPAFSTFMVADATGHLWVDEFDVAWPVYAPFSDFPRPTPRATSPWSVFDPEGRYLGTLLLPSRLIVRQIGEDYILGTHRDELGVETVRMYGLRR